MLSHDRILRQLWRYGVVDRCAACAADVGLTLGCKKEAAIGMKDGQGE